MFCKNCGKDIGDAKFCQYCGGSNDSTPNVIVNISRNDLFATIKDKIKQIGQEKLIKVISIVAAAVSIIIRIVHNEIEVVYNFLAQDDYYVVSSTGRIYMLIVMALQVVLSLFLYKSAKNEQVKISKKTIIVFTIFLAIQVLAMILRIPAPY